MDPSDPKFVSAGIPTRGRIKVLVRSQGSGIIRAARGDAFFHKTGVRGTFWDLNIGDPVTFEWLDDAISGARAHNVRATRTARARRVI